MSAAYDRPGVLSTATDLLCKELDNATNFIFHKWEKKWNRKEEIGSTRQLSLTKSRKGEQPVVQMCVLYSAVAMGSSVTADTIHAYTLTRPTHTLHIWQHIAIPVICNITKLPSRLSSSRPYVVHGLSIVQSVSKTKCQTVRVSLQGLVKNTC